jgi:hypothetical protein
MISGCGCERDSDDPVRFPPRLPTPEFSLYHMILAFRGTRRKPYPEIVRESLTVLSESGASSFIFNEIGFFAFVLRCQVKSPGAP